MAKDADISTATEKDTERKGSPAAARVFVNLTARRVSCKDEEGVANRNTGVPCDQDPYSRMDGLASSLASAVMPGCELL